MNKPSAEIFIGTMSGTSLDGLDMVAIRFDNQRPCLLHQTTAEYPQSIRQDLQRLIQSPQSTIEQMCEMDTRLGKFYADQINAFISRNKLDKNRIRAIGSHGQTIRHAPETRHPYTLQIGDANIIAALCEIDVVADFRRRDIALGGQGAPLAPALHQQLFHSDQHNRAIINIGGIGNITLLPKDMDRPVIGFDSGPGNTLIDHLCQQQLNRNYDPEGNYARSGKLNTSLLQALLQDPYFSRPPPKSTGTDYFSPHWWQQKSQEKTSTVDLLNTLTELTAVTIAKAVHRLESEIDEIYICGGGAHNSFLLERLGFHLSSCPIRSTEALDLHPDWVEATAFAWFARQTLHCSPANLPSVTRAKHETVLGAVFFSNRQPANLC